MDPIRPIGPRERDIEAIFRVTRANEDEQREQPDPREREQRRKQAETPIEGVPQPVPPTDPDEPPPLIDVRV